MSIFDGKRLTNETFKLDIDRMRRGWYSDKYFENINRMLTALSKENYNYSGSFPILPNGISPEQIAVGDIEVEMQWFTRRMGKTTVVGVDKSLEMLRHCTGYFDGDTFVDTSDRLEVWAVQDGSIVKFEGDPTKIQPVIKVRGRYRDFALLETPTLGILTRSSRVATNVYETLVASRGKPVLFFPARFDVHEVQAADGYAYNIALLRFNKDHAQELGAFVSTDAQGDWWGGAGGGTVAHAAIASFLGDTAEAMMQFAHILPARIPRIALVDFNNDSVRDSLRVLDAMFAKYRELMDAGNREEAEKYKLYGVRLDTSGSLRDVSVQPLGDPALDLGVNPRLVFNVRQGLDNAWESWTLPTSWKDAAREFCHNVKIVVSGGFNPEKIRKFERLEVPVDIYAVGSYLFNNSNSTSTDYTADVVRVKIHGEWIEMAKMGRKVGENENLERVW
ncbi:MAG TPA: nicotinate phosphoribosyltransferase [Anaerolineales bacterium]|nr:nicotinate phosphoribosyltransferase [Anaerolineales bacterium]HMV97434.1 nicotinate phosphoribosyltransferase [Anaerolineales bacterium]HMX18985.1 nicotinate phosphoribosyltransferase [Anaerolineales bacterium]HMZ42617.1 nicotinate phosphoribosyltransferase [Anaerolineales bacterium]HNA54102.1 nicotinate phosphoribosyltransferase [Anaerolineales bacterium]